jgi:ribonucleotide monophosphatase NagD (HAD superfamily)
VLDVPAPALAVVGDDVRLEIRMAREAGAQAVLVLTGSTRREDLADVPEHLCPHLVLESLGELVECLR